MLLSSKIIVFFCGFVIGFLLFYAIHSREKRDLQKNQDPDTYFNAHQFEYEKWLKVRGITLEKPNLDDLSYGTNKSELNKRLESQLLFDLVHVTCVVHVTRQSNAYLIDSTWGHKCNSIAFYNTAKDDYVKTSVIPFVNKWQFLCDSLRHLLSNEKKIEWVLLSPDDVYVIPENVRYFVATKDFNKPYYFGHNVIFWNQIYNSDKTSYLLSYGAIKTLLTKFNSSSACRALKGINDAAYNLGKQLSEFGINAGDSRDFRGRNRFHLFTLNQLVAEGSPHVLQKYSKTSLHPVVQGEECCSDTSISFRSPESDESFFLSYILYKVKLFNTGNAGNRHVDEPEKEEVWKTIAKDLFKVTGNVSKISDKAYHKLWSDILSSPEKFNERLRQEFQKKE